MDSSKTVISTSVHVKGATEGTASTFDEEESITSELIKTHGLCIDKILKESSNGFENVAKEYAKVLTDEYKGDISSEVTQALRKVKDMVKEEFADFLDEEQISFSIAELEQLFKKVPLPEDSNDELPKVWRPSGNPEQDIKPHIYEQKLKFIKLLDENLDREEKAFDLLKREVRSKRKEVSEAYTRFTEVANELKEESRRATEFMNQHAEEISNACSELTQ